eukprot:m.16086 g.16086  ORF g.16086 m.16086 type:complete len:119 (+) comp10540_c0_seq2:100-456(+)
MAKGGKGGRGKRQANSKSAQSKHKKKAKRTTAYTSDQSILVLGDGDFSFSNGLLDHRQSPKQIIATSYDSHAVTLEKYTHAEMAIQRLTAAGIALYSLPCHRRLNNHRYYRCWCTPWR